jgi:hypothetical protein
MAERCFVKGDSKPLVCGVHGVGLVFHPSSDYQLASKFGDFTFISCPVTGQVLNDPPTQRKAQGEPH